MEENKKRESVLKEIGGWILYIALILGLAYLIVTFIGQRTNVSGHSMEPTLSDHDNLIVDKLSYRFKDPERYDIIVFPYQHGEKIYYIKRIIGLPGETVQVKNGHTYINGEMLESDIYGAEPMADPYMAAEPITLGEDEYFVLGDNRNHSQDSRDPNVGPVQGEDIMGRAFVRIYPFDRVGVIRHE